MHIVFLGKPLSGKGTQAKLLSREVKLPHVSMGQLFREEIQKKTQLGESVKSYIKKGELVPDDTTISLLKKRLPKKGFILDGFPRDIHQAEALAEITKIDLVIDIKVSDKIVVKRILARRMCEKCGAIYGLDVPPKKKNVCDKCGSTLHKRSDDNKTTVSRRLIVYNDQTKSVKSFYRKRKLLWEVNGERSIDAILKSILLKIKTIK